MAHPARACRAALLVLASTLCLGSCGGPHFQRHGDASQESQRAVAGDFDDIDASVDLACSACELAIVSRSSEAGVKRFEMISVGDDPAWAEARALADDRLEIRVRIRTTGDAQWEARFLDAVQKRLAQLKGRTSAPIRGFAPFDSK